MVHGAHCTCLLAATILKMLQSYGAEDARLHRGAWQCYSQFTWRPLVAKLYMIDADTAPARCIASIAAAHAREVRDASLVRAQLPHRIDALLPTQLALQFEQEIAHIMGCAAHRAALHGHTQAWTSALAALMQLIRAVVKTVEGFEVRLKARSQIATSSGVVTLDVEHRKRLCQKFCDEIAEMVLAALPEVARIADPLAAASVKVHARQDLQHLQE
eukprot:1584767-Amphidinium_carterae.1